MRALGQQSILIAFTLASSVGLASASCPQAKNAAQAAIPSRGEALKAAKNAWVRENPGFKFIQRDLQIVELERGIWYVYAALEPGQRGGGRPEILVCAATGQIVGMSLSR